MHRVVIVEGLIVPISFLKRVLYPLPKVQAISNAQREEICSVGKTLPGTIVFDSYRDGKFSIRELHVSDGSSRELCPGAPHAMYPDVAHLTGALVFAQADSTERTAFARICLQKGTDTPIEHICENGTFPSISADGCRVFFERERRKVMAFDLNTNTETCLFPFDDSFGSFEVVKPRISPDERWLVFTSDKGGRWNAWCADLQEKVFFHLLKGCEPAWFPDNETIAWIKKYGLLQHVGIYTASIHNPTVQSALQDSAAAYSHEYFPSITPDGQHLLFAACPKQQHNHITSNYQLFIRELQTGRVTRLTYDHWNNRWPKLRPFDTLK